MRLELNIPTCCCMSSQDLRDALTVAEITEALALHNIKSHDWHIQPCCALTGEQTAPEAPLRLRRLRSSGVACSLLVSSKRGPAVCALVTTGEGLYEGLGWIAQRVSGNLLGSSLTGGAA